jgi:hypothetical protein
LIPILFFGGTGLLILSWIAGLFMLWKGQPKVAIWSCALCAMLGIATAGSTMFGPRNSDFLYGDLHRGDGFGLIGLIVLGGIVAGIAFVALIITAVLAAVRKNILEKEASA